MKPAIFMTVCDAEDVIKSFLDYHFGIGFEHVIFFFENDSGIDVARSYGDKVTVFRHYEEQWKSCVGYDKHAPHVTTELTSRQLLNAEIAISTARNLGVDWLLHIDIDEAFLSPNAKEHFSSIDERISTVVYCNHEAIAETMEVADWFKEVTLFKRSPSMPGDIRSPFRSYSNGKPAARVTSGLSMEGVHRFVNSEGGTLSFNLVRPSVLHYPHCGWNNFKKKYERLGNFPDKIWGQVPMIDFYKLVRDAFVKGEDAAKDAYRVFCTTDDNTVTQGLEVGAFMRIRDVVEAL